MKDKYLGALINCHEVKIMAIYPESKNSAVFPNLFLGPVDYG